MDLVQTSRESEPLDYDHATLWSLAEDMAARYGNEVVKAVPHGRSAHRVACQELRRSIIRS